MRANGGWDEWEMHILEVRVCTSSQAKRIEGDLIKMSGSTLNTNVAGRTRKEWYQDNRVRIAKKDAERNVKYREDNRVRIAEKKAKYYENNKERIAEQKAKYYENNKELIVEKDAKYRTDNREKIAARRSVKHACDCGGRYTHANRTLHNRSKRHQDHINQASTTNSVYFLRKILGCMSFLCKSTNIIVCGLSSDII